MLLYNNDFLPPQDLKLPITNRAFQYNDGLFETIIVVDGKLRFWSDHQARMQEAAKALQLTIPDYFWSDDLKEKLLKLAGMANVSAYGRLKLKVWRSGAGLYSPQTNEIEWLATVEPAQPLPDTGRAVGICQTVKTCFSALSHFKGPQAPLYVLAGIEKHSKGFNDMILLDAAGHVAELISSNLFWLKDKTLYTPALDTGCVNGILRRNIKAWCLQQDMALREVMLSPEELLHADGVFGSNVTGFRAIDRINGRPLRNCHAFLNKLKSDLQV